MAHTILCGQRRYTMPTVIIPSGQAFFDTGLAKAGTASLRMTNIKPPGGIVLSGSQDYLVAGVSTTPLLHAHFITEHGEVILAIPKEPTLFVCDCMIQSVSYDYIGTIDYVQYYLVPDVSYFVEVAEAYP